MIEDTQAKRWIFVSHASEDIVMVRRVRNYLERNGGSPLLFHLLALEHAEAFWPLIEKEIQSRSFFLYCDSPAAQNSSWVQMEIEAAAKFAKLRPKRIGMVNVNTAKVDKGTLNRFLADRKAFLSYSRFDAQNVLPFKIALEEAGFRLVNFEFSDWQDKNRESKIERSIKSVIQGGWFLTFLSPHSQGSSWVNLERQIARRLGATEVLVEASKLTEGAEMGDTPFLRSPNELVAYLLKNDRNVGPKIDET